LPGLSAEEVEHLTRERRGVLEEEGMTGVAVEDQRRVGQPLDHRVRVVRVHQDVVRAIGHEHRESQLLEPLGGGDGKLTLLTENDSTCSPALKRSAHVSPTAFACWHP
jgi:hypothetical protein